MREGLNKIVKQRDECAFRSLFLTLGPKVRAMLMRQGADRDTAEDIVQETMLAVWRKSEQFSPEKGAVSTWVYKIARNLRIDRLRRQVVWDEYCGELETLHKVDPQLREQIGAGDSRLEVEQALSCLSPEQKQVIELCFIDGLTQNEISARLEIPLGTVKSRMRLAFGKLRHATKNAHDDPQLP